MPAVFLHVGVRAQRFQFGSCRVCVGWFAWVGFTPERSTCTWPFWHQSGAILNPASGRVTDPEGGMNWPCGGHSGT